MGWFECAQPPYVSRGGGSARSRGNDGERGVRMCVLWHTPRCVPCVCVESKKGGVATVVKTPHCPFLSSPSLRALSQEWPPLSPAAGPPASGVAQPSAQQARLRACSRTSPGTTT